MGVDPLTSRSGGCKMNGVLYLPCRRATPSAYAIAPICHKSAAQAPRCCGKFHPLAELAIAFERRCGVTEYLIATNIAGR